jgi:D-glycero-D-manno-heptose 1,7-bisphosphate phosphatase
LPSSNFLRHAHPIAPGLPALFLDRDGVINHDSGYVSQVADVRLLAGAAPMIRRANQAGIPVIVVSNQSGLGRGLFDAAALHAVQDRIDTLLAEDDARLDAVFLCGVHPDETGTLASWRKPAPGMFLAAQALFGVDLIDSVIIGDKPSDLAAGAAARLRRGILFGGAEPDGSLPGSLTVLATPDLAAADRVLREWLVGSHASIV